MAAEYQILSAASAASGNSITFKINTPDKNPRDGDLPFLRIYGTLATTTTFDLQSKAPNGTFYTTGDTIPGLGLWPLPYSSEIILRLDYTNTGGSPSLNASVVNGTAEV